MILAKGKRPCSAALINIVQFPMSCFQRQHQKDASPMKQKKWAFVFERES